MKSIYEIKNMGEATNVLGIRILKDRNSKVLYLDQEKIYRKFI